MKRIIGKKFSEEEKLKIIQEYLDTDISQDALVNKYKFGSSSNISKWMRKFGMMPPNPQSLELIKQMAKEIDKTPRERELEQKLKDAEKALEYKDLRIRALETMIDIAENDLNIPIRKKPGTKQ
jgi:transposase